MDKKNMVNIDDLVRKHLAEREDDERPAAWLNMRDMLDAQMPIQATGGYGWRRMLFAGLGFLLIASLTVGGYKFWMDDAVRSGNNSGEILSAHIKNTKQINDNIDLTNAVNTVSETSNNANINSKTTHQPNADVTTNVATDKIKESKNDNKNAPNHQGSLVETNNTSDQLAGENQEHKSLDNFQEEKQIASSTTINTSQFISGHKKEIYNTEDKTFTGINKNIQTQQLSNTPPSTNIPEAVLKQNSSPSVAKLDKIAPVNPATASLKETHTGNLNMKELNVKGKISKTASLQNVMKDTFPKISIVRRTIINPLNREVSVKVDTLMVGSVIAEFIQKQKQTTAIASVHPRATMSVEEADSKALVALSTFKVDSKKSSNVYLKEKSSMKQIVEETKAKLSGIKFYPGITGGVNKYITGPHNLSGIHIGLRGVFAFNENWNMLTELKYYQRFSQNNFIEDHYVKLGSNNKVVSDVEHFFKYSSFHSMEAPLAIEYAYNRLNIFGGANIAYNFTIPAEEITREFEPGQKKNLAPASKNAPLIHLDDFHSRWSIGYLLGIGYSISPAVDIDVRFIQNVWDNAKTGGAKQISKELYKIPSLQLSVGYRFGEKNKIPRAR